MDTHFFDLLHTLVTIATISGIGWKFNNQLNQKIETTVKDSENRLNNRIDGVDKRIDSLETSMNARFDKVDERLARIEQNHHDHLMYLHVKKEDDE